MRHLLDGQALRGAQQLGRAFAVEDRVAREQQEEESVAARRLEHRDVEHGVVRLRKPVEREHSEHAGQRGEQDRRFLGHNWWVWDAQFSPDEKKIVTASQDGTAIVWDALTGEPGAPFTGHAGPVYSAAFSSNGDAVVTGGYDKRVLIWRPSDVRPYDFTRLTSNSGSVVPPPKFKSLDGHEGPVRTVALVRVDD